MTRRASKAGFFTRLRKRVMYALLCLVLGTIGWTCYLYHRTSPEERSWGAAFSEAFQLSENAYVQGKQAPREIKKRLIPSGDSDGKKQKESEPSTDSTEGGGLEEPIIIARVVRVVDGDTIVVETSGKEEKVRLLMINTPESVHPDKKQNIPIGKAASDYVKEHLMGKQVRLAYEPGHEKRDHYGRELCYIWLGEKNFNLELVEEGWSPYYTAYGRSAELDDQFREAEKKARDSGKGIWGDPELKEKYLRLKSKWGQKSTVKASNADLND